jgi:hypothetical protein
VEKRGIKEGVTMNVKQIIRGALAAAVVMTGITVSADEYKFKIVNTQDSTIKKILVSEDGEEYGFFDIGAGVKPGQSATLVWDSSTDGESCEQYVKAVYADGSESEPVTFDFCESGLELEF